MKRPAPPFLELSFYFANTPSADAFARLVTTLMDMGATFTGEILAHQGADIRNRKFASITDDPLPTHITMDVPTMRRTLTDSDIRFIKVYMDGATGVTRNIAETVSYLSISPEAALTDQHPLAIFTEGEVFSGALRHQFPQRARKAGARVYQRFRALIEALQPAYAAITVETALECPVDLYHDPRSMAFCDFFVSQTYIGRSKLNTIQTLFEDAFIEPMGNGLYVSSTEEFNLEGRSLATDLAQYKSVEVAKLIAAEVK